MASEKPGKLKFNAAMFNPAAMRPGSKNKKLEELKKKRANAPTQPLKTTGDQFSRPSVPRRRAKSKSKDILNLDNDEKKADQKFAQSFINNDPIIEEKTTDEKEYDTKTDTKTDTYSHENETKIDKDKLDTALRNKKSINPESIGYIDPNKISPAIQDVAKKLEHKKKSDHINQKLTARADLDEMLDTGYMPADPRKVHGSLHDKQQTLSQGLDDRASKDFLHKTKILKYDNIDASIQPMADTLEQKLSEHTGMTPKDVDPKIAPSLAATSKQLDHQIRTDNVSKAQKNRTSLVKLQQQGIIPNDNVAPSLAATTKQLDKQIKTDKLSQSLTDDNRKTQKELSESGVLKYSNLSNNLIDAANKLEARKKEDKLNKNMRNRPDIDTLHNQNIINKDVDPSLQSTQNALKMQRQKDKLNKGLRNREDIDTLHKQNIINKDVDPSLQSTQNALKMQRQKDKLNKGLRNREDIDTLHDQNILNKDVDPVLQSTQNALKMQQQKDKLTQGLRNRADIDTLHQQNILNKDVDPALQLTQNALKSQQQKDKLSKGLRNREDIDTLHEQNILNKDVDPALQSTQNALKMQQQKDKLNKGLRNREEIDKLHEQNIITPNVAPQLAAKQRELDSQKKKDVIRQKLDDEDRPTQSELEQQDILYSQQIAPSLQSNAKDLEEKMREIQYKNDENENGSTQSIDQSPTQTDIEMEEEQRDAIKPLASTTTNTSIKTDRKRISKSLESRLSIRKTPRDLENYGIVPPDYFDDPQGAYEMRLVTRKLAAEDLKRNLKSKPSPHDLVQRGYAHDEFWEKSVDETRENRRNIMEEKKRKLTEHHKRRPSIQDLVAEKIMPEDSEVINELKNIAKSHTRMESAVNDLSQRLPFEDETNKSVAETMMKHINDTEDDIELLWTTTEDEDEDDDDDEDNGYKARESEEESERDPNIDYDASSDIEQDKDDTVKFDLDAHNKRNHKRRLSQDLENFYANRKTMEELEDDGIIKQTNLANSLRGNAVALEERMNNMPERSDLIAKNIIKRPSLSRSLQPNAEALEYGLIQILNKFKEQEEDMELKHVEQEDHPLFKRDNNSNKRRKHTRKKSSGFGTKKNMNPEYYKHDIAPKLQETANRLHKRKISQQIERSLNARPTKGELIDQRILYKEHMANQLQANAMKLEEQLKQRVPENYLQMRGVLIHDQDKVAPSIQGPSYELEYALRRRPSLFDGAKNGDVIRILGIPTDSELDHHEFYTNELFKQRARGQQGSSSNDNDNKPLVISAFEEMYPDDNDKAGYRLRRARNSDKLEKRMSLRMSKNDLQKANVIPANYFDDPHGAIEMQQIHRKLAAEDLKRGLRNRSTKQELIDRGLTRAEYFDMDMSKAKKAIAKHSHSTKQQVENQLNSIFNPQLIELEKRGIVESGYFLTRAKQIEEGHRRLVSVTSELQQKLLSNPSYNEELAKTLVQDLRSDSDDEENDTDDNNEHGYDQDTSSDGSDNSDETESSEFMDSDDEEQARRLQELEYKIGHRPSTDELIEKHILYKKISQMAPSIQGNAQQLQKVIGKRPSLQAVSEQGILIQATNQDMLDKGHVITHKKKEKKKKHKSGKKGGNKHALKHAHLNKKIGRRRPTMIDLEKRGIVPTGYFDDVEQAMTEKKIRKENIIHDLTSRLQSRPEFSEKLAGKLMAKAMDSIHKREEMVESGRDAKDKEVIQQILTAKLSDRMNVNDLKNRNILSSSYDANLSHRFQSNAEALKKKQLRQTIQDKLNAQPTEDELYDQGYIKFKRHGNNGLSSTFHPVAVELEELIQQRPNESYLEDRGIINPITKKLNDAMKSRPSIGHLEQTGIALHGSFDDLETAKKAKHDRVQSIHDELNAFFQYDRPPKKKLIEDGIFNMPQKRRGSIEIKEEDEDTEDETDNDNKSDEEDDESIYNSPQGSPDIPPVPERPSSMFQQNTYTEIVMNSITFHNKKAVEPSYSIDLLVAEPDLTDDIIQTSTLSFLNVLDNLQLQINEKIEYANENFISKMKVKSTELQSLKSLLRNLQQYGLTIVNEDFDGIDSFQSSGDVEQDIDNVFKEIMTKQKELYDMDNEYMSCHVEIKKLQNIKNDLSEYCDKYKIQLSQLKRVKRRIVTYINENKMTKDSSNEAMKATDSNQAWMISKITNKIVKLQSKIDSLTVDSEEYVTCKNFLNGLKEFLKGLKKLRKSSTDKINHLQNIIDKLKEQELDIINNIKEIRSNAIIKLDEIRRGHTNINMQPSQPQYENKYDEQDDDDDKSDIEIVDFSNNAPLSMLELMHKREKYMTKVYKKIHDLESRAMTTSSTDYLRGLTEIRELQIILNNPSLKYFYNHFVSVCNEIFNDMCLANQAILENTAEINTPLLTNLKGIQLLNDVLDKNKRKLLSDDENTMQYLDDIVVFIQSLPDREVVIMQIARHLSLSLPFRSFIVGQDEVIKEREKRKRLQQMSHSDMKEQEQKSDDDEENEHHLIKIDKFINNKIREWIGSILNIYGNNAFSSVRIALENDVIAQVRPSHAAKLIVNCVYGLDVSL